MRYYRWASEVRDWRGKILQANIQPFLPDWFRIDQWNCSPIDVDIPAITFHYSASAPKLDLIFSSSGWEPYSSRLRDLLREARVSFEEFPCVLRDRRSGDIISEDYAVVHFLGCRPCFDWDRSIYENLTDSSGQPLTDSSGHPVPTHIEHLVIVSNCGSDAPPAFRLSELPSIVLVADAVHDDILQLGITGVSLTPVAQ